MKSANTYTPETAVADLVTEARAFCARNGITLATLSCYAVNDGKFFDRLISGSQCLPRTMANVRAYMAEHDGKPKRASRRTRKGPHLTARALEDEVVKTMDLASELTGLSPMSVGSIVFKDSRFYRSAQSRADRARRQIEKLNAFIQERAR